MLTGNDGFLDLDI
jgi:hypothetical protein